MLYREWEILRKEIASIVEDSVIIVENIDDNQSLELLTNVQQTLIHLGTILEKRYGLQETAIIKLLEDCCEELAEFAEIGNDFDVKILIEKLRNVVPTLKRCLEVREVSLVLIAKNEAKYIVEWLEYHLMVGVRHFYIYDNDSTDNFKEILKKYIDNGAVTYHYFPGRKQQLPAYNHAIENYKEETEYMGFIDADEFIVPVEDKSLPVIITEIFEGPRGYYTHLSVAGIGVNWRTYGTSFNKNMKDGLVTRNYVYRGNDLSEMNQCVKTICNPRMVTAFTKNPHQVDYPDGSVCISENGSYIFGPWFRDGICNKLRINHYYSKSTEELCKRFKKGKADSLIRYSQEYIAWECNRAEIEYNQVYDFIMEKYVDELERRVATKIIPIEANNEKVSVIIPTYNRQDKLLKSINSVLEQTYSNIEIIVVDDASTDSTQELVENIRDQRVRYIKLSQNMGAAGARNEGVKAATSDIIAFHDSDDVWRADKLEKQMDYMKRFPEYAMVYCAYQYHKENIEMRMPLEKCEGTEGYIFPWLLVRNTIGAPTVVMKKSVFMELGGFNSKLRCLEDWEFVVRLAEKYSIGYVDEILMDAHFSGGSVSSQTARFFETRCYMIAEFKQQLMEYKLFDTVTKDLFDKAVKIDILNEVKDMLGNFLQTI